eukprot:GHVN01052735.1.p1 GENE.GHVN01052735.1~~GHVN01052735.1.p1  ORF type:complete len:250 (-),score=59.83 GHVN01052735.1:152-901(-)
MGGALWSQPGGGLKRRERRPLFPNNRFAPKEAGAQPQAAPYAPQPHPAVPHPHIAQPQPPSLQPSAPHVTPPHVTPPHVTPPQHPGGQALPLFPTVPLSRPPQPTQGHHHTTYPNPTYSLNTPFSLNARNAAQPRPLSRPFGQAPQPGHSSHLPQPGPRPPAARVPSPAHTGFQNPAHMRDSPYNDDDERHQRNKITRDTPVAPRTYGAKAYDDDEPPLPPLPNKRGARRGATFASSPYTQTAQGSLGH